MVFTVIRIAPWPSQIRVLFGEYIGHPIVRIANSGYNPRGCHFLLPSVGPSHRPDVLGMRKRRRHVETPRVPPMCARRSDWYNPSSEYVLFRPIIVLLPLSGIP